MHAGQPWGLHSNMYECYQNVHSLCIDTSTVLSSGAFAFKSKPSTLDDVSIMDVASENIWGSNLSNISSGF